MAVYSTDIRALLRTHAPSCIFGDFFPPQNLEALKRNVAFLIQERYVVWVERIELGKHQAGATPMYRLTASVHPVSLTASEKALLLEAASRVWDQPESVDFHAQGREYAALAKSKGVQVSAMAVEFC